jgi:hypothetical protein
LTTVIPQLVVGSSLHALDWQVCAVPHALHAPPLVPQAELEVPDRHLLPWQQPEEQLLALQVAGLLQTPEVQVSPDAQVTQLCPPAPQ